MVLYLRVRSTVRFAAEQGSKGMPINRLLKDSKLEPEKVERLNRAYSYALRKLRLVDRDDPIVDIIAKKIIEVGAATGARDAEHIAAAAIEQLGVTIQRTTGL